MANSEFESEIMPFRANFRLRHVTGSFLAYRFVTPVRITLTGTRSGRIFHVRFGTGPVAGLSGTGSGPDKPVIPVESTG